MDLRGPVYLRVGPFSETTELCLFSEFARFGGSLCDKSNFVESLGNLSMVGPSCVAIKNVACQKCTMLLFFRRGGTYCHMGSDGKDEWECMDGG